MKKLHLSPILNLLLLLIFFFLPSSIANAQYSKLQGYAGKGGQTVTISSITTSQKYQQTFPSCTVTVFNAGTSTKPIIYSDNIGTVKANPFTAGVDASWSFYIANGTHVDVQFSGTGFSTFTLGDLVASSSGISTLINVKTDYGAKGNGILSISGGSISASSSTLTCSDCSFTSTAVDSGKLIDIEGAGSAGKNLVTTISSITNSTHAILSTTASTTVSGKHVLYGTNDRAAIQSALNSGHNIYFPASNYIIGTPGLSLTTSGYSISGDGMFSSILYSIGSVKQTTATWFNLLTIAASNQTFNNIAFCQTNWTAFVNLSTDDSDGIFSDFGFNNVNMTNVRANNAWSIGIHCRTADNWTITNSQGSYNGNTAFNVNVNYLIFSNNLGIGNGTGMLEASGEGMTITGNVGTLNRGGCLSIGGRTSGPAAFANTITGNSVYKNGACGIIVADDNQTTTVVGNVSRLNDVCGLQLTNSSGASPGNKYNLISNNIFSSNGCTSAPACTSGSVSGTAGTGILAFTGNNIIQGNKLFDEGISNYNQQVGIQGQSQTGNKYIKNDIQGHSNIDYYLQSAVDTFLDIPFAASTIDLTSATGTIYSDSTFDRITINKREILTPTVVADTSLNPFTPTDLRFVYVTLTGNRTIDPFNGADGQIITFIFVQDGTGNRTLTYSGGFRGATNIAAGQAAGKANTQSFIYRTGLGWVAYTSAIQNY